jgi:hypothetical protein
MGPVLREENDAQYRDFHEFTKTLPPSPAVEKLKAQMVERVDRDAESRGVEPKSGRFNIEALLRANQETVERAAAARLKEKDDQLRASNDELARVRAAYEAELKEEKTERKETLSRREKRLLGLLGAIVLMVASALVGKYIGPTKEPPPHGEHE